MDVRFKTLDKRLNQRFASVDTRFEGIDARFDAMIKLDRDSMLAH